MKVTNEKGGWAIKGNIFEGKIYIYHGGDYHSLKCVRDLMKNLGVFQSIKSVEKASFRNKNGKPVCAFAFQESEG